MIDIYISKGVLPLVHEVGYERLKKGDNILDIETAHALEQVMWNKYQELGNGARGRAAESLSRGLATELECHRSIEQVEAEILTVLDSKWDNDEAVETHIQLMVHRGWTEPGAKEVINRVRSMQ